jgi:carbonic anhydrase/acetyltransferase-like protein (isoleucine patch superfamily)
MSARRVGEILVSAITVVLFAGAVRAEAAVCTGHSVITSFDFGDGAGAVPAHRHAKGCGIVANTATVGPNAYVGPNARVYQKAKVLDTASIEEYTRVYGSATVKSNAKVRNYARVYDTAIVGMTFYPSGRVSKDAIITGSAIVRGNARIGSIATVRGNGIVEGDATVNCGAIVDDNGRLQQRSYIAGVVDHGGSGPCNGYRFTGIYGRVLGTALLRGCYRRAGGTLSSGVHEIPLGSAQCAGVH